jgi:hypothetical protein
MSTTPNINAEMPEKGEALMGLDLEQRSNMEDP